MTSIYARKMPQPQPFLPYIPLLHLCVESREVVLHVIAGPDAREQPVAQWDGGVLRGHEATYLRQHHDESHLPVVNDVH